MKSPFVTTLLVVLCGVTAGLVREHIFINIEKKWQDALNYCHWHYSDLSSISSEEENEIVKKAAGDHLPESWIGLYKSLISPLTFLWSDRQLYLFEKWKNNEPSDITEKCVQIEDDGWNDRDCEKENPFFCERILVLVKETKTWEEAYEYCRAHYTGLAFLSSETQLNLAKKETNGTQTVSVWTGLRFLAGEWLWVNGEPLGSLVSLPSCPAGPYRCGAQNSKMDIWENRDCEEKLNFLCY
uniref:C-type lectin domain-containing protein n=1 Tax=Pygocentrus nattereri TaxID=42514 RepID=A0AAR2K558_PYGNA